MNENSKYILIEYLYLDLQTCDRCLATLRFLEEAIDTLAPVLRAEGYEIRLEKIEMATAKIAKSYRFLSSPTIRINGRDMAGTVKENNCACCSDISTVDTCCRVYEYEGQDFEVPPMPLIRQRLMALADGEEKEETSKKTEPFQLPDNLIRFFQGKEAKRKRLKLFRQNIRRKHNYQGEITWVYSVKN